MQRTQHQPQRGAQNGARRSKRRQSEPRTGEGEEAAHAVAMGEGVRSREGGAPRLAAEKRWIAALSGIQKGEWGG